MNSPKSPIEAVAKIAVVGDVHDQWSADDTLALDHLNPDLVLFVGDFGNESVEVTRAIANLDRPKAVILGNHDAWYSATQWGREKCPYDRTKEDWVQQQLDLLGITHVGYGKLDLPTLGLSVVGGRPFSWGGPDWRNRTFYRDRYGVHNFEESTTHICQAIDQTDQNTLIIVGHCGPQGLGEAPEDPCGRDWTPLGGDFGDPDLTAAIAYARKRGKHIPLVTFGHMHHSLRHRKDQLRRRWDMDSTGTLYLNAASVPRIVSTPIGNQHNFSLVTLNHHQVSDAVLAWVNPHQLSVETEELYSATPLSTSTA